MKYPSFDFATISMRFCAKKNWLISVLLSIVTSLIMSVSTTQGADQIIGFSYSEGLAFNKIDMLDYDTKFESIDPVNDNTTNEVTLKKIATNFLLDIA